MLIYHRVALSSCDPLNMAVSPTNFDEQVRVLAAEAHVVDLAEELRSGGARRPRRGPPRFAITFDDGYVDNLEVALPVLERYDVPATIFIASRYLDQPYFWWDRLAEIVFDNIDDVASLITAVDQAGVLARASQEGLADEPVPHILRRVHRAIERRSFEERMALVDELGSALSFVAGVYAPRPLTSVQLQELADHPLISIGAHTSTHPPLTAIPPEGAFREVVEGGIDLDRILGPSRRLFAYPGGGANWSVARLVRRAGHEFAFTTQSRPLSLADHPLRLPRIGTADVTGDKFALQRNLG